eukprot:g70801.t1
MLSAEDKEWFLACCEAQHTKYRGVGEFLRDYSVHGDDEVEAKRYAAVLKRVTEGKAAGSFDRPPFPNPSCPHQAIVAREFTIPKDKWNPSSLSIRNINHGSFPRGLSVNDLTPRLDIGVDYFTFAQHISKLAALGPGCWGYGGDVKDAYRQLGVRQQYLYQQVSSVWDSDGIRHFFVELCGKFGQVAAGDNFVRVVTILKIVAKYLPDPIELDNYVDNFVSQAATEVEARAELHKLTSFCKDIGLDLHEVFCEQRYKFLGWIVDTVRWLVIIPDARLVLVLEVLHGLATVSWVQTDKYASYKGLLTWLATFVAWLRPLMGHMHECHTTMVRRGSNGGRASCRVRDCALWAARLVEHTKGEFPIVDYHREGHFDPKTLLLTGDHKCITIWCDANKSKSSQWGRAWLVASDGQSQGSFLAEP